jgi:hypothetical protein
LSQFTQEEQADGDGHDVVMDRRDGTIASGSDVEARRVGALKERTGNASAGLSTAHEIAPDVAY